MFKIMSRTMWRSTCTHPISSRSRDWVHQPWRDEVSIQKAQPSQHAQRDWRTPRISLVAHSRPSNGSWIPIGPNNVVRVDLDHCGLVDPTRSVSFSSNNLYWIRDIAFVVLVPLYMSNFSSLTRGTPGGTHGGSYSFIGSKQNEKILMIFKNMKLPLLRVNWSTLLVNVTKNIFCAYVCLMLSMWVKF